MHIFDINKELILAHKPPSGPFVMANLFRLKDGMKFTEFLQEMTSASEQTFEDARGEILYAGKIEGEFTSGEIEWDAIILVRFPNWETLLPSVCDRIDRLNAIRRKYLFDYKWIFTTPI